MQISLAPGTDELLEAIDSADIPNEKRQPKPGQIYAAAGDLLNLAGDAVPYAALAMILAQWIKAKASREITLTTKDYKVLHTKGFSASQFEELLKNTSRVTAIDMEVAKRGKQSK